MRQVLKQFNPKNNIKISVQKQYDHFNFTFTLLIRKPCFSYKTMSLFFYLHIITRTALFLFFQYFYLYFSIRRIALSLFFTQKVPKQCDAMAKCIVDAKSSKKFQHIRKVQFSEDKRQKSWIKKTVIRSNINNYSMS